MESGTGVFTWIAYGAICLFLLIVSLVVLRSVLMMGTLVLMPIMQRWNRDRDRASTDETS